MYQPLQCRYAANCVETVIPEKAATPRQAFEREMNREIVQPPPPFPPLPEVFVSRYDPEIQAALREYSAATQEWVKKYVQGTL